MKQRHRKLWVESLEHRRVLAAAPFQNVIDRIDVNGDGQRTIQDGLAIVQYLHRHGSVDLSRAPAPTMSVDVNGDNRIDPRDVLDVVVAIRTGEDAPARRLADQATAEGEQWSQEIEEVLESSHVDFGELHESIRQVVRDIVDQQVHFWRHDFVDATHDFVDALKSHADQIAERVLSHLDGLDHFIFERASIGSTYREVVAEAQHWNSELNELQRRLTNRVKSAIEDARSGEQLQEVVRRIEAELREIRSELSHLENWRSSWLRDIRSHLDIVHSQVHDWQAHVQAFVHDWVRRYL